MQTLRDNFALLSRREQQAMNLVVTRMLNQQLAGDVGNQRNYSQSASRAVMQKMCAESLADLVNMAASLGLGRGRPASGAPDYTAFRRLFQPWKADRSPALQASRSPGVFRSQSGRISLVTARRSCQRSVTEGRPQNQ